MMRQSALIDFTSETSKDTMVPRSHMACRQAEHLYTTINHDQSDFVSAQTKFCANQRNCKMKKDDHHEPILAQPNLKADQERKKLNHLSSKPQKNIVQVDRPGFDLGGSSSDTTAGTGLGLGDNSSETAGDRSLPNRRSRPILSIPRWGTFGGDIDSLRPKK